MEFYSAVKKTEITVFAGKWTKLEYYSKWDISGPARQTPHVPSQLQDTPQHTHTHTEPHI